MRPFFIYRDVMYVAGAWMLKSDECTGCSGSNCSRQFSAFPPSMGVYGPIAWMRKSDDLQDVRAAIAPGNCSAFPSSMGGYVAGA